MGVDRKGGVSLYGLNATTPSRPGPEVSTRVEALNMVAEKNAEVLQMKDKLASLEQTCSQMSAQMSQMLSMMSTLHKATPPQNIPNTVSLPSVVWVVLVLCLTCIRLDWAIFVPFT